MSRKALLKKKKDQHPAAAVASQHFTDESPPAPLYHHLTWNPSWFQLLHNDQKVQNVPEQSQMAQGRKSIKWHGLTHNKNNGRKM